MNRVRLSAGLSLALLLIAAPIASAHPGHDHGGALSGGLMHPFSGIDHMLAMIAVGLLAAQRGGRALWLLPSAFVAMMIGGGLLNLAGARVPMVEQGIMASVLVLGLAVAAASCVPFAAMVALVAVFATFHGYAHVAEMRAGQSPALYALGFVIATATLHAMGIALGMISRRAASTNLIRIGGAAIAGCGVLLFTHLI
jgi:urease accessory protein